MLVRLLQWNIQSKENIRDVTKTIQEIDPDIVNLQELTIENKYNAAIENIPAYIAKRCNYEYYFHEAHKWQKGFGMGAIGNGIYTRFKIVESDYSYVREQPTVVKDITAEGRVYVESVIRINKSLLTVGNVHLSYVDEFKETPEKKNEADRLVEIVREKKNSFILSGDLNSTPTSYTINQLSRYLVHCGPPFGEKTWTTKPFKHREFSEKKLNWRLDYVFGTEDLKIHEARIINVQYSDHLPIVVTFEIL